jgi:predicted nuclease of predicted toxin-antitoxin system
LSGLRGGSRTPAYFAPGVKLLYDENLAPSLVEALADIFPESLHIREVGLKSAPDPVVWAYAATAGCMIVSKDADFRQRSFLYGHPPKVIWIRLGNCSTQEIARLLRDRLAEIERFSGADEDAFLGLG